MERAEKLFSAPTPANVIRVDVELDKSDLITHVAGLYVRELGRLASVKMDLPDQDTLVQYFCTLVALRCETCNEGKPKSETVFFKKVAVIPAFFGTLLVQIGVAFDREYGLRFIPKSSFASTDIMGPKELTEMSDLLSSYEPLGLKLVTGIPKAIEGELGFMACKFLNNDKSIMSYRRDHPIHGFYASFFRAKWLEACMDGACRIRYDYEESYRQALAQMVEI